MKDLIIKNMLEKLHMSELPTNTHQFQDFLKSDNISKNEVLLLLGEFPKYGELYMSCLYEITTYYKFDEITVDLLIDKLTKDCQEKLLTENQYYLIIQWLIDNETCYVNYVHKYLQIINKCENDFIKINLSKSISKYEIPVAIMDEFHHLIDWKIFQEENNIYELFHETALNSVYMEDYDETMLSLVTKDYLKHSLNYNSILIQCIDNYIEVDDNVLLHMLRDYDTYHISFYTLVKYCNTFSVSREVINFICTEYKPPKKTDFWTLKDLTHIGVTLLKNMDLSESKDVIIDNLPFFLNIMECKNIIKKHFKYNWQMCKKIREFEAKKDKYLNNK